jgi:hypothetical protein
MFTPEKGGHMKSIMFLLSVLGSSVFAAEGSRTILKDSKTVETMVSTETVRCSQIGYGSELLKINIAALDGWTLFDHSNSQFGEFGQPCMSAGRCKAPWNPNGLTVDSLVQSKPGLEKVTIEREVIETKHKGQISDGNGGETEVCVRQLVENLKTNVRGIEFVHSRSGAREEFPIEVCNK